jgi:KDO2-lipid IV(A) lauroyltransferase
MKKTAATSLILFIFRCIPLGLRKKLFISAFRLFYHCSAKQRLIALHNLRCAYPEKSVDEIVAIAKGVYRHVAIVAAEFFELPYITKETLSEWVEFEGLENFNDALTQNKGILSVVAHFGNWELMPIALPMAAQPMHIVYRPLDSSILDDMMAWVRTLHGNTLIEKEGAAKKILRLLRENQAVGILSDQNVAAREGVFVDFFDRPACTTVGTAILAMRTGAPVLPAFMARMANGKYRFIIKPPVEISVTGDNKADILTNTQRFTRIIEDIVREYPDQWFWIHQRWKTKKCQKE